MKGLVKVSAAKVTVRIATSQEVSKFFPEDGIRHQETEKVNATVVQTAGFTGANGATPMKTPTVAKPQVLFI